MGIRHGLPGQYSKIESKKKSQQIMGGLILAVGLLLVGLGFIWGYFLHRFGGAAGLAAIVLLAGILWYVRKPVDKFVDKRSKERLKWMRGGQGEALISYALETEL